MRESGSYETYFENVGSVFGNEVVIASPSNNSYESTLSSGPKLLFVQDNPSKFPKRVEEVIQKLREYGYINKLAVANILGQIEAESQFNPSAVEGSYSAKRLYELWGKEQEGNTILFNSEQEADELVKQGKEAVYNRIYGHNKNKLGNKENGDGYRFRGRGYLQLTGRANYEAIGRLLLRETAGSVDLVNNPDLAARPEVAVEIVPLYLQMKKIYPNNSTVLEDVEALTKKIGPADKSLEKRVAASKRFYRFLSLRISPGDVILFRREDKNLPLIWYGNTRGAIESVNAKKEKVRMRVSLFFSDNFAGKRSKASEVFSSITEINTFPPRFTPMMIERYAGSSREIKYGTLKWGSPFGKIPKSKGFLETNIGSLDDLVPVYKGFYLRVFNVESERFLLLRRR